MKDKRGITLVSLVVTIIVLLILAGVSLNLVSGSDGILGRASTAADKNMVAKAGEEVELLMSELQSEYFERVYMNSDKTVTEKTGDVYVINHLDGSTTSSGYTVDVDGTKIAVQSGSDVIATNEFESETSAVLKHGWLGEKTGRVIGGGSGSSGGSSGSENTEEDEPILVENLQQSDIVFAYSSNDWTSGNVTVTASIRSGEDVQVSGYTLKVTKDTSTNPSTWANASTGVVATTNETVYAMLVSNKGTLGTVYSSTTLSAESVTASINFNGSTKINESTNMSISAASALSGIKKVQLLIDSVEVYSETVNGSRTYSKSNIGLSTLSNVNTIQKFGDCTMKIIVTSVSNQTTEESYTVQNYTVGNATCLNSFAAKVNGGNTFSGETVIQLNDITTSNHLPIGYVKAYESRYEGNTLINNVEGSEFSGTYDGKGHTIIINGCAIPSDLERGVGIFGNVRNATIKNLISDGSYTATKPFTGGICGVAFNSTFDKCCNKANLSSNYDCLAGIVGCADINDTITSCVNKGNLSGQGHVAGISGYARADVINCYNTGNISYSGANDNGGICGAIGSDYSKTFVVSGCYNTGTISGNSNQYGHTGGIVGIIIKTNVSNCYNLGSISNSYTSYPRVGGCFGTIGSWHQRRNIIST